MSEPAVADGGAAPAAVEGQALPVATVEPITKAAASDRPTWLPERYETPEKFRESWDSQNALIGKKFTDLSQAQRKALYDAIPEDVMSSREKELREQLAADEEFIKPILESRLPKAPENYEIAEGVVPPDVELIKDHEAITDFTAVAKKYGLSNEAYNEIVSIGMKLHLTPRPGSIEERMAAAGPLDERMAKMGPDFPQRVQRAQTMALNSLPAELHPAFHSIWGNIYAPEEYQAIEALVKRAAKEEPPPGMAGAAVEAPPSREQLEAMQRDPRYFDPNRRDPGFVEKIKQGYARLAGNR